MSHEQISKMNVPYEFPDSYPFPENQHNYEKVLRETIATEFPERIGLYDGVIHKLDRSQSPSFGSARLYSNEPDDVVPNEGLPLDGVAIIGGIYALTGAEIIQIDSKNNGHRVQVIRRGSYDGEDVYFTEEFYEHKQETDNSATSGSFEWVLHGQEVAKGILERPTQEQWAEFHQITGTHPLHGTRYTTITKDNYKEVAEGIADTEAVKRAEADQDHAARREAHLERLRKKNPLARLISRILEEDKYF